MPGDPWPNSQTIPSWIWNLPPMPQQRQGLRYDDIKNAIRFAFREGQRDPASTDEDAVVNALFVSMFDGKDL